MNRRDELMTAEDLPYLVNEAAKVVAKFVTETKPRPGFFEEIVADEQRRLRRRKACKQMGWANEPT